MKKIIVTGICLGLCTLAQATTINAPTSLTGYEVLSGENAYSWGVPIGLTAGQTVSSATISFSSVTLNVANSSGVGYLYADLLNLNSAGVTPYYDGDAPGAAAGRPIVVDAMTRPSWKPFRCVCISGSLSHPAGGAFRTAKTTRADAAAPMGRRTTTARSSVGLPPHADCPLPSYPSQTRLSIYRGPQHTEL